MSLELFRVWEADAGLKIRLVLAPEIPGRASSCFGWRNGVRVLLFECPNLGHSNNSTRMLVVLKLSRSCNSGTMLPKAFRAVTKSKAISTREMHVWATSTSLPLHESCFNGPTRCNSRPTQVRQLQRASNIESTQRCRRQERARSGGHGLHCTTLNPRRSRLLVPCQDTGSDAALSQSVLHRRGQQFPSSV